MESLGESGGVRVYDSYAHHPSEIRGDLEAARSLVTGDQRLIVAFQPHLVSRTRIFGTAMGRELGAADDVLVLDVYVAREDPDPEVTGALVAGAVPLPGDRVRFVPERSAVVPALVEVARPGDLVLTLGAGDVTALAPQPAGRARGGRSWLGSGSRGGLPAPTAPRTGRARPSPAGSAPGAG
ncbi:cyanophycin synthetase [Nocardioides convexus]|uniref:glutamate ligase domain-containing protein n=1 Tax=Nocardioides convexus TaxID=2712224 RepID=UPI002418615E|nr:cyanophycin synthetase [Nocardioides convexus]